MRVRVCGQWAYCGVRVCVRARRTPSPVCVSAVRVNFTHTQLVRPPPYKQTHQPPPPLPTTLLSSFRPPPPYHRPLHSLCCLHSIWPSFFPLLSAHPRSIPSPSSFPLPLFPTPPPFPSPPIPSLPFPLSSSSLFQSIFERRLTPPLMSDSTPARSLPPLYPDASTTARMPSENTSSRRWTRFLHILSARRRRTRSASPPHHPQPRFNRRSRNRRNPADRRSHYQQPRYFSAAPVRLPPSSSSSSSQNRDEPRSPRPTHSPEAILTSTLAELDPLQDHDILAVVNRIFDEYQASNSSDDPPSSIYFAETQNPTRRLMRVHNAYYIANRRHPRHSQLSAEFERLYRLNMGSRLPTHTHPPSSFRCAASDDQIEALPTFVMAKDETRSVREIFASMKAEQQALDNHQNDDDDDDNHHSVDDDEQSHLHPQKPSLHNNDNNLNNDDTDECGGLMTSYTECAICLCDFEPGDEITLLPCGHFFHLNGCIREWLRNHARTCPTCRADICASPATSDSIRSQAATQATSVVDMV